MKRIILWLTVLVILAGLTGCGGSVGKSSSGSESKAKHDGLNKTFTLTDYEVTAIELIKRDGQNKEIEYFKPAEGNIFVGIIFDMKNISEKEKVFNIGSQFTAIIDNENIEKSDPAAFAFSDFETIGSRGLQKNESIKVCFPIEVPATAGIIRVEFSYKAGAQTETAFFELDLSSAS